MMGNIEGFNAEEVEPNTGFTVIPGGDYPMIIVESAVNATKEGNGSVAQLKVQILSGEHQNRTFRSWITLTNKNGEKNVIGRGQLSSICRAVNVLTPKDTSELHNKPFLGVVATRKDSSGNLQNELKGGKPRHTKAPQQQQQAEQPANAGGGNGSPFA